MKRRFLSALLIFFLAVTMLVPTAIQPEEASAASFTVRTSMPKLNDKNAKYYYSDLNRFWKAGRLAPDFKYYKGIMDDGKTGGYVWGNCTWWAYSRASEVIGEPLNPNLRGNAGAWWECNKKGNYYPYGSTPKVGALVVYRTHVAFIEKIVNGQIYVSESGWQTRTYGPSSTDDFFFHYGKPWSSNGAAQGYIYVTDKSSSPEKTVSANYSVNVSVSDLRMRSGPGTGYSNMGTIKKGTHQLKAATADGEWGQLKSNGYWISLEYTTRASSSASTNNNLKSLSVSGYSISPSFKAGTGSYSLTVPSNVSSVTIKAAAADSKAKVTGAGKVSLATGTNTKTVTVKAQSGTTKKYTLKITRSKESKVKVSVTELNMRSGPGTGYKSKGKIKKGTYAITQTSNGWGKLKTNGNWISLAYTKAASSSSASSGSGYKVKINVTSLNMRSGPGTNYKSKGKIKKGTYAISQTKSGWGKLQTNGYWIKLSFTSKVSSPASSGSYKVRVNVSSLNMRSGPGIKYKSKGKLKKGTYTITSTKSGWGKIKNKSCWIKLSYTARA